MIRMGRLGRLFLWLLAVSVAWAQNPPLTTVADTVYQADGTVECLNASIWAKAQ